jgi:hypothetical protein
MLLVVVVALTPGGFLLLLAYVAARMLRERWQQARAQAQQLGGAPVSLWAVLATLEFREIVRQARSSF